MIERQRSETGCRELICTEREVQVAQLTSFHNHHNHILSLCLMVFKCLSGGNGAYSSYGDMKYMDHRIVVMKNTIGTM
jgi:hypothetical protein